MPWQDLHGEFEEDMLSDRGSEAADSGAEGTESLRSPAPRRKRRSARDVVARSPRSDKAVFPTCCTFLIDQDVPRAYDAEGSPCDDEG